MRSTRTEAAGRLLLALISVIALLATACGDAEDSGGTTGSPTETTAATPDAGEESPQAGEQSTEVPETELTVLIPFPSGITFYPLFVAEEKGFFGENVSISVEATDGSGAAAQQLVAGNADVCLCGPGTALRAVAQGEDIVSVYTMYQKDVFSMITPTDSDVNTAEDLTGATIGVDAREGGAESWLVPSMSAAGLQAGEDYEITAVGAGGAPLAAFDRGEVEAYAGAFVDHAILRLRGLDFKPVEVPGADIFFDSGVWMNREFVESNPGVVQAFVDGLAEATEWGMEVDGEQVIEITSKTYPEESEEMDFALALLEETNKLFSLPDEANGQWGYTDPERVQTLIDKLVEQGALEESVDSSVFINDFVTNG